MIYRDLTNFEPVLVQINKLLTVFLKKGWGFISVNRNREGLLTTYPYTFKTKVQFYKPYVLFKHLF
jgi:hypothetical protein